MDIITLPVLLWRLGIGTAAIFWTSWTFSSSSSTFWTFSLSSSSPVLTISITLNVGYLTGRLAVGGFLAGVFANALPLLAFFCAFIRFAITVRWAPLPPSFFFGGIAAGVALFNCSSKRIFGLGLDCRRRGVKGIVGIFFRRMDYIIEKFVTIYICPLVVFSYYLLTLKVFFYI